MKQLILTLTLILATNFVFAETNEKEIELNNNKTIYLNNLEIVDCIFTTTTTTTTNADGTSTSTTTRTVTCDTPGELKNLKNSVEVTVIYR